MTRVVKTLVAKPVDLSSIPGDLHGGRRESGPLTSKYVPSPTHAEQINQYKNLQVFTEHIGEPAGGRRGLELGGRMVLYDGDKVRPPMTQRSPLYQSSRGARTAAGLTCLYWSH